MNLMLLNYVHVIKTGYIDRLTVSMKCFNSLFKGLTSFKSKYAIECVHFLTKTKHKLFFRSVKVQSVTVIFDAFVNSLEKPGTNKAADMQQENNYQTMII